jgi:hypothetical protein
MTTLVSAKEYVETYNPPTDVGPWELVNQYYKATKTSAELRGGNGGRAGSQRVASHLGLPRGRLRGWIDEGGKPDAQRGLERANEYGWIDVNASSRTFDGLNRLVAQVFAGGSITADTYAPWFAIPSDDVQQRLTEACRAIGADYEIVREHKSDQATELRIRDIGSILGRVLAALGAPVGEKARNDDITLPAYLDEVSQWHRLDFARIYVQNRGAQYDTKDTISIREDRSQEYRDEVASFLENTIGESVTSGDQDITLSADAARAIQ